MDKTRLASGIIFIGFLFFFSSCANNQEYIKYTNDQIIALKKTTEELKEITGNKVDTVTSGQAAIMIEIETLKNDISELAGRVEDNEHLIKYNLEKELGAKGDEKSELSRLTEKIDRLERMVNQHHRYLNLEPIEDRVKINDSGTPVGEFSSIEPGSVSDQPNDVALYESNLALYKSEKYEQALSGFKSFLDSYPKSDLADNAQFWIGECLMSLKQYEPAILAFQKVIKDYPNENKVPNAMLRQAFAMLEIGDPTSTKLILKKLIKAYPKSPEAEIAEKKLATIK